MVRSANPDASVCLIAVEAGRIDPVRTTPPARSHTFSDALAQLWPEWLMTALAAVLAFLVLQGVIASRSYPQVHDAAIMRYVTFMIDHGHAPYTGMVEMNPPGTLKTEWLSRHAFGDGAAGLWRWDTFLGLLIVAAAAWIAGRGYRQSGVAGALLAWLLHQADGMQDFAQRDWVLSAILLLAAGCAAESLRRHQAIWMAPAMCLAAWACTIKPFSALFLLALLAAACARFPTAKLRREMLGWSAHGASLPLLAVAAYFAHWPGSFTAFVTTERTLGAWYAQLDRAPLLPMVLLVLPPAALMMLALWMPLCWRLRCRMHTGDLLLFAGFLCGAGMYLLQRKAFPYQTYPMMVFALPGALVSAQRALPCARRERLIAVLLLLSTLVWLTVQLAQRKHARTYSYEAQRALKEDLKRLGGDRLSRHVQCLDMTLGGCIGALAELHLEQSTGFVNDHMLFPYANAPLLKPWQQRFLADMQAAPPQVIVMSNHNWPNEQDRTFSKPNRWPEFAMLLQQKYRLEGEHLEPTVAASGASYRIYIRR